MKKILMFVVVIVFSTTLFSFQTNTNEDCSQSSLGKVRLFISSRDGDIYATNKYDVKCNVYFQYKFAEEENWREKSTTCSPETTSAILCSPDEIECVHITKVEPWNR
jgi:hypothetical protein